MIQRTITEKLITLGNKFPIIIITPSGSSSRPSSISTIPDWLARYWKLRKPRKFPPISNVEDCSRT